MGFSKFFGKMLGTDEALKTTVKGVRDGFDALVYTDEEKATDAKEERAEARKMVVSWMVATQGQNLARRLIALSITAVWLIQYIIAQFCSLISVWATKDQAILWIKSAESIKAAAGEMTGAIMLILTFYFAAPHMGQVVTAALNRLKENKK